MAYRLLIVDDAPTIRALIRHAVASDDAIHVVGEAADPLEAREAIKRLNPDVITLDINMPHMDGLSFLEKIMRLRPTPVVVVSSFAKPSAEVTLRALEIGAIDCVEKPCPGHETSFDELAARIRVAAQANLNGRWGAAAPQGTTHAASCLSRGLDPSIGLLAIGASTGGVEALLTMIRTFPKECVPTVIVQHMLPLFTASFAQRLNRFCAAEVSEATDGSPLVRGRVYLAPGGKEHLEVRGDRNQRCVLREADPVNRHRPSVDVLFRSVAKSWGQNAIGVLLTGLGRDGAAGLLEMRRTGARTFAQDEATSVVYGMPRAAFEIGAVCYQLPLESLTYDAVCARAGRRSKMDASASRVGGAA